MRKICANDRDTPPADNLSVTPVWKNLLVNGKTGHTHQEVRHVSPQAERRQILPLLGGNLFISSILCAVKRQHGGCNATGLDILSKALSQLINHALRGNKAVRQCHLYFQILSVLWRIIKPPARQRF